jgi:ribosome-associated protein
LGTNKVRTSEEDNQLPKPTKAGSQLKSKEAAYLAANAAEAKKSHGTLVLDVGQVTVLADYFVIAGGETLTQVRAIVDAIEEALSNVGFRPRTIEGKKEGRWVLMDYEDIIVHVLHERERNFYKLEQFWNHALIVDPAEWLEEEPEPPQLETRPVRRQTGSDRNRNR